MRRIRTAAILTAFVLAGAGAAMAQAAPTQAKAPRTPHSVAGRADCLSCHGPAAIGHVTHVPAAHRYANATCSACHRPAEKMPPGSQHAMDAAHTRCAVCHVANNRLNAKTPPASHSGYDASVCRMCHEAAPRH
jgi:hypothetical protein